MIESRVRPLMQILALAAIVGPCTANLAMAGETKIFEWREANGVISYSQKPPPTGTPGVTSREIETKTLTPAQRAAVRAELAAVDAAQQADSARYRAQLADADKAVSSAVQSLSAAEHAARSGRSPQAGERVGNAGGGSRLRTEYFDRQKNLEDAVQQARSKVDEAYRKRSAIAP